MYQPLHNEQQRQQQSTVVMQTTAAALPVTYVMPPASTVCERYASCQSKVAGIILIIAGVLSIIFNIIGIIGSETAAIFGQGLWCGIMVSL